MPVEIKIAVDDAALKDKITMLKRLAAREVALAAAKQVQVMGTRAFRDPSFRPREWPQLAESTHGRHKKKWDAKNLKKDGTPKKGKSYERHQPLIDTGALMRSLYVDQSAASANDDGTEFTATVVSDREYAAYHQFGGTSKHGKPQPPARPFLPFEDLSTDGGTVTLTARAAEAVSRVVRNVVERLLRQ